MHKTKEEKKTLTYENILYLREMKLMFHIPHPTD
jgi:hypothetical protein